MTQHQQLLHKWAKHLAQVDRNIIYNKKNNNSVYQYD